MAGFSSRTKHFGLRIPLALWARLQAASKARSLSIATILLEPWQTTPAQPGRPRKEPAEDIEGDNDD
jgi:hypothetical protein